MLTFNLMTKQLWLGLVALAAIAVLTACSPAGGQPDTAEPTAPLEQPSEQVTMLVGPELVECVGVGPQSCLQIKFAEDAEWELFYDAIVGFEFVPGFEYELLVNKTTIENPPADASAIQYELIEVVRKTAVETEEEASGAGELLGTDWDLVTMAGEPPLPDAVPTISFTATEINGSAGCNSYFGSYTLEGAALMIGEIGSTLMFCQGLMEQEEQFMDLLEGVESLALDGGTLTLHATEGELVFRPAEHLTLEGVQWTLGGIVQDDAVVSTWVDSGITAEFQDGTVAGSAGCNSFSASYEAAVGSLTLGEIIRTQIACVEAEVMEREEQFLAALAQAAGYEIRRETLTLTDAEGNALMTFQAQP